MMPNPTLEDLVPRLHSYDARIQRYNVSTDVSPHLAFNAERANYNSGYYYQRGRGQSNRRFGGGRGRGNFSTRGRGFHQQLSSGGSRSGSSSASSVSSEDRPSCQICGRYGHSALRCWNMFNNSYNEEELSVALAAMRITDVTDNGGSEWFADSGASAHITNSTQNLAYTQPYRGSDAVLIGDGNFLPITQVGSADIASTSGTLPLRDVLVCPDITKSLLSVSKLTRDFPCSFEFDADGVCIKDKQTKRVLRQGSTREDLYVLPEPKLQTFYSTRQVSASDEVWH